ncbi:PorT family protein [Pseudoflavitalea sp. X16]|uniref:porin family protein n=1 Tax=Paraflavitalea devenefica TaxID=2716334 RepID=UPI00142476B7|nr:porin family protein [Paraflavitalea devenefica]NII29594.1 PorT family protein [Paraflavitalea devenefica]
MKKLIVAGLLLIGATGFAQTFQLGIKAGVNISNFTGGEFENLDKKALVGFHGGGFVSFFFGEHLALQPEVLFSSQGAKIKEAGDEKNWKISYINVPVLLKYRFTGGFFLEAGPQIGFKVSEDIEDMPIEDFAKSTDLSIAGGLGWHSSSGLGIGARYTAGISKVGDFDAGDIDPDFKNGVIQISLFYTLFNNKK